MPANYTQSRAAILAFGGWGLQTALHLLPRLQAAQEQRTALGAVGPDLLEITSFGLMTADPLVEADGGIRLHVHRPTPGALFPPRYVERLLEQLTECQVNDPALLDAERRSVALYQMADSRLERLSYGAERADDEFMWAPAHAPESEGAPHHACRSDIFRATVHHADRLARLLEMFVLDPIREDSLDPDDPFVQTTLYVIAPLFEPLASAMVWPAVTQLLARVGRRHLSQVVGVLATGSYAMDQLRNLEDAAGYVALRELEQLTGLESHDGAADTLDIDALIPSSSPLTGRVGEELFDFIYLLDREKSNQGLADDSHELAVLAGNALESLIVAGGNFYVQEQLGFNLHSTRKHPYSLLGATTDFVPVHEILHAVNRQEESRLVREWILRSTPAASPNPLLRSGAPASPPAVADLGFNTKAALEQLVRRHGEIFVDAEPATPAELIVRDDLVLPPLVADVLRRRPAAEWPRRFDAQCGEVQAYLATIGDDAALADMWGLEMQLRDTGPTAVLDDRLLPRVQRNMHQQLVEVIIASPSGLRQAADQVERWRSEVAQAESELNTAARLDRRARPPDQLTLAHQAWQMQYIRAVRRTPSLGGALLRALLATGTVTLISLLYLQLIGNSWRMQQDGLALAGFAAGTLLAALLAYRITANRVRELRRERLAQAQQEISAALQANVRAGLLRAYGTLATLLERWADMLADAQYELHELSTPPSMPTLASDADGAAHLYTPHLSERLWDACLDHLRTVMDAEGQRSEDRLDTLWGRSEWRTEMRRILRGAPMARTPQATHSQAQTIAQFIRNSVRRSVAPGNLAAGSPARTSLIQDLARDYTVEDMLWRQSLAEKEIEQHLQALESGQMVRPLQADVQAFPKRNYVETAWNRAKPTANYDVSDRLAVYGVTIDFVATSGDAEADLTHLLPNEFNMTLLPTQNPFGITFVRTVHGLALDDLDCMQRYRAELALLDEAGRALILLT